jgi:predicted Zn finger-like uncharacterized protein
MSVSNAKIQCPECRKVYTLNKDLSDIAGKRNAKCSSCEKRFIVEFHPKGHEAIGGISFLRSYFEKRSGSQRRAYSDRRKVEQAVYIASKNLPNDIIPLFNSDGDSIIGHISPGRRNGNDRRRGFDRRQGLS